MEKSHCAVNQRVLVAYLTKIIEHGGWWYRIPKFAPKPQKDQKKTPPLAQDAIMPHMGQVFGLTEEAAVLVLVEMGLILQLKNGTYLLNKQGWTDLGALFKVNDLVEISLMTWNKKVHWYVRLGTVGEFNNPRMIWSSYQKNSQEVGPLSYCYWGQANNSLCCTRISSYDKRIRYL
jgi:hypothetical protein